MTKGSQEFFKQTVAGADSIESRAEAYKSVILFNETVKLAFSKHVKMFKMSGGIVSQVPRHINKVLQLSQFWQ